MRVAVSASLGVLFVMAAPLARAQGDATGAVASSEMDAAVKALGEAEAELAAGTPCVTMCKALQSMMGAADRICELAKGGSEHDQKRCGDARAKVAEAIASVRKSCPDCNPSPPLAPSTTPVPAKAQSDEEPTTAPDAAPLARPVNAGESVSRSSAANLSRTTTITLDPLAIFLPTYVVQLRVERALTQRTSLAVTASAGSLPNVRFVGPKTTDRPSVGVVGAELRRYVVGQGDGFGVFVSADVTVRTAASEPGTKLDARGFVPGMVIGPLAGVKLVTEPGFTIETRVGVGWVARDERPEGTPRDKVVPIGTIGVGWAF